MSFPIPSPNMYPLDPLTSHAFFSPQRSFPLAPLFEMIRSEIHEAKTEDGKEHLLSHGAVFEGMHEIWEILDIDDAHVHAVFESLSHAFKDYQEDHKIPTSQEWQHIEEEFDAVSAQSVERKKAIEAFNYTLGIVAGLRESTEATDYEYAYGLVDSLHALHINPPESEQHYLFDTLHQDLSLLKSSHEEQAKQLVLEDVHNIYKWMDKQTA